MRLPMAVMRLGFAIVVVTFFPALTSSLRPEVSHLLENVREEKYLWYAPHSGFGNQLIAFRHALRVAGLLNRTLIVPPVLRHFDLWFGRCEEGTARDPDLMRKHAWRAVARLLISENYLSLADVVDISDVPSSLVKTIDLRLFAAIHCGINVSVPLTNCTWCGEVLNAIKQEKFQRLSAVYPGNPMEQCGHLLGNLGRASDKMNGSSLLVAQVRRDCSNTVWTYSRTPSGDLSDDFRTGKLTGKCPGFTPGIPPQFEHDYIKEGLQVMMEVHRAPIPINIVSYFSKRNTVSFESKILSFGSAMHFYDLEILKTDERAFQLSCQTTFLPFTKPIMQAAKLFAQSQDLRNNFVCLHFRGGDGYFRDPAVQNASIHSIREQLESLYVHVSPKNQRDVSLFVMTDLMSYKWRRRIRRMLGVPGYILRFAQELSALGFEVQQLVQARRYGLFTNRVSKEDSQLLLSLNSFISPNEDPTTKMPRSFGRELLQMSIFLEQTVCSCAPSGFIGHPLSTISQNVHHLRAGGLCGYDYRGW